MKPRDLGLPKKFREFRPHQLQATLDAVCADTRFSIMAAPPGVGKTPAYIGVANFLDARTMVLTENKNLQRQLMADFKAIGLYEIKGQNNYPCLYFEEEGRPHSELPTCDEGPCHAGIECVLRDDGCYYYDAVRRAARSRLVVGNYSYWMFMSRYAERGALGEFDLLVLDEAHKAADILAEFVKVDLDEREVRALLNVDMLHGAHIDEWVEWAREVALPRCRVRLEAAKSATSMSRHSVKVVRRLVTLEAYLNDLAKAQDWKNVANPNPQAWVPGTNTDWVIEENNHGATFQPTWASGYAEQYLFRGIPRVLLVSATVTPRDAHYLGVSPSNLEFHSYPSPFKAASRSLIVIPTVKVSRDTSPGEYRIWMNRIDEIVDLEARTKKLRGIIHTVSYGRSEQIARESRYPQLLAVHTKHDAREVITRFKEGLGPPVLVSPIVTTGYDFPGDECHFQIIAKLPFIDTRPAVIDARSRADKHYTNYACLVTLMQMVGRGTRSERDWCRTYLIDNNWFWFYPAVKSTVPRWFRAAIRRRRSVA